MKNFTKRILLSLALIASVCMQAFSQEVSVSGKVTDGSMEMPGVNVQIKGTVTGTVTDINGEFALTTSSDDVLVFSFIGYATQEITVGSQTTINVTMVEDVSQLDEVVVIGYGETTVKDATGAVAAVSAKDFNGGVISSPEQLIAGKTAGVQITSTSGAPGDGVQLRIRGTSSIRSNNNPLFVVDGVPLAGGTQPSAVDAGFGTTGDTNPLNFINPSDIQSMSILKDASATAIYGSRGANGVVIITTKSGRGTGGFEFSSNASISSPANKYDLLSGPEYLSYVQSLGGDPLDGGFNTDWQDYVTRTSFSHRQNLAYSKGFKTGSIRASFGYDDQQGVVENSWMKRLTGRINGNKSFMDDKLNLSLQATYSNVKREDPPISGNAGHQGDLLGAAYSANPTWDSDPDFPVPNGLRSPSNMLKYFQANGVTNRALTNVSLSYELVEGLVAKAAYGLDWSKGERITLTSGDIQNAADGVAGFGDGQINENKNLNNLVELTLTYTKELGSIDMEIVGGYSFQSFRNQWFWSRGKGYSDYSSFSTMETELRNSHDAADAAASAIYGNYNNWGVANDLRGGTQSTGGFVSGIDTNAKTLEQSYFARPSGVTVEAIAANFYDQTDYLQSYFARGNFTINDKYIITATVRADGSSKFGSDNQYGIFPSGAVAWKLHDEAFMPDVFSTFKLRAGYGVVGNQDGLGYGEFIRRDRWADASVDGQSRSITVPGQSSQGSVNPGLKWEATTQVSVGIDFGIMGEKIYGSFDVYNKQTTDLLLRRNSAQPAVADQIYDNLDAIVENKGWELALTFEAVETDDLGLSISGNISRNKNMLKDFGGELDAGQIYGQGLTGAYAQRLAGGHPLFAYHLRVFEGFDDNGQPIGDNQTYIGKSALPEWNTGLSINARYKNFDLAAYMTGQFGHYVYNNTQNAFFTAGSAFNGKNVTKDLVGNGEAGNAEAAVSTRFLESGNFLRMQTLSLGYAVPMSEGGFIKSLKFNVTAQNLFLITNYSGLDPEVSSTPANFELLNNLPTAGIDYTAYPRPRTFTFGLNASF